MRLCNVSNFCCFCLIVRLLKKYANVLKVRKCLFVSVARAESVSVGGKSPAIQGKAGRKESCLASRAIFLARLCRKQNLVKVDGEYANPAPKTERAQGGKDSAGADCKHHEISQRGHRDRDPSPLHGQRHCGGNVFGRPVKRTGGQG